MASAHVDAVVDACSAAVRAKDHSDALGVPATLYHFTDVTGLTGILTNSQLWASLATALNDSSEIGYGRTVALDILTSRLKAAATDFDRLVWDYLTDPNAAPPDRDFEAFPFVISFCGTDDRSGMWLNYGRAGRGLALGFEDSISKTAGMDFFKIDYDKTSQIARMTTLLDAGSRALGVNPKLEPIA